MTNDTTDAHAYLKPYVAYYRVRILTIKHSPASDWNLFLINEYTLATRSCNITTLQCESCYWRKKSHSWVFTVSPGGRRQRKHSGCKSNYFLGSHVCCSFRMVKPNGSRSFCFFSFLKTPGGCCTLPNFSRFLGNAKTIWNIVRPLEISELWQSLGRQFIVTTMLLYVTSILQRSVRTVVGNYLCTLHSGFL